MFVYIICHIYDEVFIFLSSVVIQQQETTSDSWSVLHCDIDIRSHSIVMMCKPNMAIKIPCLSTNKNKLPVA